MVWPGARRAVNVLDGNAIFREPLSKLAPKVGYVLGVLVLRSYPCGNGRFVDGDSAERLHVRWSEGPSVPLNEQGEAGGFLDMGFEGFYRV